MLARIAHETGEQWFLFVPAATRVTVNGQEPFLGAQVLADRDEIRLSSGRRLYFSTERLAQVVPFPGADHEVICARCRTPITKGTLAVACPACGAWCHQTQELPCWSYPGSTHCPLCDHPNALDAGFRWSPNDL